MFGRKTSKGGTPPPSTPPPAPPGGNPVAYAYMVPTAPPGVDPSSQQGQFAMIPSHSPNGFYPGQAAGGEYHVRAMTPSGQGSTAQSVQLQGAVVPSINQVAGHSNTMIGVTTQPTVDAMSLSLNRASKGVLRYTRMPFSGDKYTDGEREEMRLLHVCFNDISTYFGFTLEQSYLGMDQKGTRPKKTEWTPPAQQQDIHPALSHEIEACEIAITNYIDKRKTRGTGHKNDPTILFCCFMLDLLYRIGMAPFVLNKLF